MLSADGAVWHWHNSSTGCALQGDFPSYSRNYRDEDMVTQADCEKEHIGESLQEMYNVMAFLPCFPTYNSKIFSFVSIILTVNNLFMFCIILFP